MSNTVMDHTIPPKEILTKQDHNKICRLLQKGVDLSASLYVFVHPNTEHGKH